MRRIAQSRRKQERKPYYDDKDKEALKLMRKLRVDWSDQEDSFLLICKVQLIYEKHFVLAALRNSLLLQVAGAYLCRNMRPQMVQFTLVRDLLHAHFPESHNKTSRACQRRLHYMMKNKTTADNVTLFLADIERDQAVS